MTTRVKAGVYFALWIPAAVLAIVLEGVAIGAFNATGIRGAPSFVILWLNLAPAWLTALALYVPLALWVNDARGFGGWRGHFYRGAMLYLITIAAGILLVVESSNPDFWLYGQLILWPGVVAAGGIVADLGAWALKGAWRTEPGLPK